MASVEYDEDRGVWTTIVLGKPAYNVTEVARLLGTSAQVVRRKVMSGLLSGTSSTMAEPVDHEALKEYVIRVAWQQSRLLLRKDAMNILKQAWGDA